MTCLIIDDEINAVKSLRWDIDNFITGLEVLEGFSSVLEAIDFIKTCTRDIDIVFLDINMPEMNGFQFLEEVKDIANFEVIFTTAHLNFALSAIKAEAIDYLLKPIDSDELRLAVEKVRKRLKKKQLR